MAPNNIKRHRYDQQNMTLFYREVGCLVNVKLAPRIARQLGHRMLMWREGNLE